MSDPSFTNNEQGAGLRLSEFRHSDGRVTITLFDDNRRIAQAKPLTVGGYLIVGYGLCLLDKLPSPTTPNDHGVVDPTRTHCKRLPEARKIMARLAAMKGPSK